jgi:hypothetical protein
MQFDKIKFSSTYLKLYKALVRSTAEYDSNRGTWNERDKE